MKLFAFTIGQRAESDMFLWQFPANATTLVFKPDYNRGIPGFSVTRWVSPNKRVSFFNFAFQDYRRGEGASYRRGEVTFQFSLKEFHGNSNADAEEAAYKEGAIFATPGHACNCKGVFAYEVTKEDTREFGTIKQEKKLIFTPNLDEVRRATLLEIKPILCLYGASIYRRNPADGRETDIIFGDWKRTPAYIRLRDYIWDLEIMYAPHMDNVHDENLRELVRQKVHEVLTNAGIETPEIVTDGIPENDPEEPDTATQNEVVNLDEDKPNW